MQVQDERLGAFILSLRGEALKCGHDNAPMTLRHTVGDFAISPDGQQVAIVIHVSTCWSEYEVDLPDELYIWQPAGGRLKQLTHFEDLVMPVKK